MPVPLRAAAIVPATCVPWSLVVGRHPRTEVSTAPASVQFTDAAGSMFSARSGWSCSIPESSTPTRTSGEPLLTSWASSARMTRMSHCFASRGSGSTCARVAGR